MPLSPLALHDAFRRALLAHRSGDLTEAERLYRTILAQDPEHPNALHYLGVVHAQHGRYEDARRLIEHSLRRDRSAAAYFHLGNALTGLRRLEDAVASYDAAIAIEPAHADAHFNRGNALGQLGRLQEALDSYDQAVALKPDYAEAHSNRGNVLRQLGRHEEALASYDRAAALRPQLAEIHYNRGRILTELGRFELALESYNRALALRPSYAEAHMNRGNTLVRLERPDEAVTSYEDALRYRPDYAEAHNALGSVRRAQMRLDEAITSYRRAVDRNPRYAAAHRNLAEALLVKWELDDAVAGFRRAVELAPDDAEAYGHLATALLRQGNVQAAADSCRRALELDPELATAHWNQAFLWLLTGDLERGFLEYEWRWRFKGLSPRVSRKPAWDGRPLPAGMVLIHTEQGLGDAMQFIRYARLVRQRVGTVVLECGSRLSPLLGRCGGIDQVVSPGDALPEFDAHVPLMSLPRVFHTTLETIPHEIPYLFADPGLVEQWRIRLRENSFRVGIAWQGNPQSPTDGQRSIPLIHFTALAGLDHVQLYSLQKGPGTDQLDAVGTRLPLIELGSVVDDAAGAFMDTAAIMKNLDLVITSDTSIAHLAGGLGIPVWVLLRHVPDWRWLLDRSDSPWYPTMRLFRQQTLGDWDGVFRRVAGELQALVASR